MKLVFSNKSNHRGLLVMHAASEGHEEIVKLLLARGADVNGWHTALMQTLPGSGGKTALMEANSPAKIKLLVARGAQLNAKDEEGETALMHAVDRGDVEVVDALLQAGADASVQDAAGATALMHALSDAGEAEKVTNRRLDAARLLSRALEAAEDSKNAEIISLLRKAIVPL